MKEVYRATPVVDRDCIDLEEINVGRQFQRSFLHPWTLQIAIKLQKVEANLGARLWKVFDDDHGFVVS